MAVVRLGGSGLKVSNVALGTMTFGKEADEATAFRIMDRFLELGHFFLDTANSYNGGRSEEIVGTWMKERGNRASVVIATKVFNPTGPGPNERGLSRINIMRAVDESLRRLGTDVIDLYQIHRWDSSSPVEETVEALADLVRWGKVRYLGASNLTAWQLSLFLHTARGRGLPGFVSLQPVYNAVNRGIETEVLPLARYENLGVIPYNPLAAGFLTGKYGRDGKIPELSRLTQTPFYRDRYYTEEALDIAERFVTFARQRGCTPAQLALAWVRSAPGVTAPIIGARNLEQLNDTIGGMDIVLAPGEREKIPAVGSGKWVGKDPVHDRDS